MQFKTLALFVASAAVVAGQNSDLPSCAQECFTKAIATTPCSLTDEYCQCSEGSAAIATEVTPCLEQSSCTADDITEIQDVIETRCSAVFEAAFPDNSTSGTCSNSSANTPTSPSATQTPVGAGNNVRVGGAFVALAFAAVFAL